MKLKNKQPLSSYERAQKRIKDIKGFYGHLTVYVMVNLLVLFTRAKFLSLPTVHTSLDTVEFLNWLDWNTYGTSIIWGIALIFHGIKVFVKNPFFGKAWEERQIKKYMNQNP